MSLCGLGLSCEPMRCEHGVEVRKEACHLCVMKKQMMVLIEGHQNQINDVIKLLVKGDCALENDLIELRNRVEALHEHKLRQIDENRKILKRVDELQNTKAESSVSANYYIEVCEKLERLEKSRDANSRSNKDIFKRIDELTDAYKADYETAKEIIFSGAQTHASILRCEAKIEELEQRINDIESIKPLPTNKVKCPTCGHNTLMG